MVCGGDDMIWHFLERVTPDVVKAFWTALNQDTITHVQQALLRRHDVHFAMRCGEVVCVAACTRDPNIDREQVRPRLRSCKYLYFVLSGRKITSMLSSAGDGWWAKTMTVPLRLPSTL